MTLPFSKLQGTGNDFVLMEAIPEGEVVLDYADLAKRLCDRRRGIGADGLITVDRLKGVRKGVPRFQMEMWNPDGSKSEMCGNGLRCAALYFESLLTGPEQEKGLDEFDAETGAGRLVVHRDPLGYRVDMGLARLSTAEIGMAAPASESFIDQPIGGGIKGTAVSMGNPHLVLFTGNLDAIHLERDGRLLENHPFFPNRTNVHFVHVLDRNSVQVRIWERGAGATLSCGTGVCAVAVACFLNGKTEREIQVRVPGGTLQAKYEESGHVFLTGPVAHIFSGEIQI